MGGNLRQWCEDWFNSGQTHRVLRGASWDMSDRNPLLSSSRTVSLPDRHGRTTFRGFRCVLAPVTSTSAMVTAPAQAVSSIPVVATKEAPFANTLGMKFVPVPGTSALFSVWDTRVQDYAAYALVNKVDGAWTNQQKDGVPVSREPEFPVVRGNWDDANAFCHWLTENANPEA